MDEPRRQKTQVALAIALLLGGAWLLYAGASYVSIWIAYEARTVSTPKCGAAECLVYFALAPPPSVAAISYVVAIPAFLAIAWWLRRGRPTRLRRVGSDSLMGVMGWMALLIAVGAVWPFLLYVSLAWSLFLVSVLVVPTVVVAVGTAFLGDVRRQRHRIPPQDNGG